MTLLAGLLEAFFTDRLQRQRAASPHTIAAYRDTFRLLLRFAQVRRGTAPSNLRLDDVDAPFVSALLDHLEKDELCLGTIVEVNPCGFPESALVQYFDPHSLSMEPMTLLATRTFEVYPPAEFFLTKEDLLARFNAKYADLKVFVPTAYRGKS